MGLNQWVGIGRLTKDPEEKWTSGQNQMCVCTFTLAVDKYKREGANFFRIKSFGNLAQNCIKYLGKGSKVCVQGSLENGEYEKDGRKIYYTEILANSVEFLSRPNTESQQGEQQQIGYTPSAYQEVQDDDIPY